VLYPLVKDQAGNAAWTTMHHRASLYSDNPTDKDKQRMKDFLYESMRSISLLCKNCKNHIKEYLKNHPLAPALDNKEKLSQYLCEFHNSVNKEQGKETHDCTKILRPKEEVECKNCHHEIRKDTTDLKAAFERFKEISTKVFHALCDRYKVPYPTIKFHECPNNPLNSCTSMWIDSQTQDIAERPVVYLHPNLFGLRSIVHEFLHYLKQLKKDTMGSLDEEEVERQTQSLLNHEFPFDEMDDKDKRAPVITTQATKIVRNDYVSRLRNFPYASRVYDKHLVNVKRRDYPRTDEMQGDWVFDSLQGITQGKDEGFDPLDNSPEAMVMRSRPKENENAFSFLDGLYSPVAALFGMKASDINMTNTPMLISNATLAIIKSQLSPIGALLLSTVTSLGIFGALAFSKNGLSYGDKLLMNNFGSNFLWSSLDYVRPDTKQEVIEGAMDLGNAVSAQRWDLVPHVLLGDTLSAMLGESSTASPQSATRNLQRAAQGASSGSLAGGRGNVTSNTIKSAAIDPRQQMADLRNYQKEAGLMSAPDNPQAVRPVHTGAAGANPAAGMRPRIGGSGVNSMPMYDDSSVMIPSDEDEQFESAFGMHVADGSGGASTRDEIDMDDQRNTVRDIFNQDEYYYQEEDVY
jgi:Erv1/Alr family protein